LKENRTATSESSEQKREQQIRLDMVIGLASLMNPICREERQVRTLCKTHVMNLSIAGFSLYCISGFELVIIGFEITGREEYITHMEPLLITARY
jgi:hypothetical protein